MTKIITLAILFVYIKKLRKGNQMAKTKRTVLCRGSIKILHVVETDLNPAERKDVQKLEDAFKKGLQEIANSLSTDNRRVSVDTWGLIVEELPTGVIAKA